MIFKCMKRRRSTTPEPEVGYVRHQHPSGSGSIHLNIRQEQLRRLSNSAPASPIRQRSNSVTETTNRNIPNIGELQNPGPLIFGNLSMGSPRNQTPTSTLSRVELATSSEANIDPDVQNFLWNKAGVNKRKKPQKPIEAFYNGLNQSLPGENENTKTN